MQISDLQFELIFKTLTKEAHYREQRVFRNELKSFLKSDKTKFYFLSDDYYESYLHVTPEGFTLQVLSEDESIVARTQEANHSLASIF